MPEYNRYKINAATLLVGVGGMGSSIVSNVYTALPKNYKKNTYAHIFDTDVHELHDHRYEELWNKDGVTQISPPFHIGTCIESLEKDTDVRNWFPDSTHLTHTPMIQGAAQVRAVSRLALLDTIKRGAITRLNRQLDNLLTLRDDREVDSIRIVIVNSLAGGTGSGSFLQLSLYIREYLKRRHVENATIRAFFLMPEIFIQNGDYKDGNLMERTVRANGYACFKEIDALIRLRSGTCQIGPNHKHAPLFAPSLEYAPNFAGRQEITRGQLPFDVITLFDYWGMMDNGAAAKLNSKGQYIRQVEDAIRLHLFSPLEGRSGLEAHESNLANLHLKSENRSRYAGSGSAALIYPFDELSRYMALRWVREGISKQWQEIDDEIDEQIHRAKQDRAEGILRELPDKQVLFGQLLRDKAESKNAIPFYRLIYDQAHILDERGQRVETKHNAWLDAVKKRLNEALEQAIGEKANLAPDIYEEDLLDAETLVYNVRQSENNLRYFSEELGRRVDAIGLSLAKDIVWRPYRQEVSYEQRNDALLNTWILGKDEPMHPLAIRYFLGEALQLLDKKLISSKQELKKVEGDIESYDRIWDHESTKAVEKTAAAKANVVVNLRFAGLRGKVKEFAQEFLSEHDNLRENIKRRAKLKVYVDAYEYLAGYLKDFLTYWQDWFHYLDALYNNLSQEIRLLEDKHDKSSDVTKIYVRASAKIKKNLWEQESVHLMEEEFPPEICERLYMSFYRSKGRQYIEQIPPLLDANRFIIEFRQDVLPWCEKKIKTSPKFNMNIAEAIESERKLLQQAKLLPESGRDFASYLRSYLDKLNGLAIPWVLTLEQPQHFTYTCLSDHVARSIGERDVEVYIPDNMINNGFSKYEIVRVNLLYGLHASHFTHIAGNDESEYRRAYREHLAMSCTRPPQLYPPHLDRFWGSPAFLPELDEEEQKRSINDIYRAIIYLLAWQSVDKPRLIFARTVDQREYWHERLVRHNIQPLFDENNKMISANIYGLIKVFAANYDLVAKVLASVDEEEDACRNKPKDINLLKKLDEVVKALSKLPNEAPNPAIGKQFLEAIVIAVVDEIQDIFYRLNDRMPRTAADSARPYLQELLHLVETGGLNEDYIKLFIEHIEFAIAEPKYLRL